MAAKKGLTYFYDSIVLTLVVVLAAGVLGYYEHGHFTGAFDWIFLVLVLALLEISISFENAVVNATVLKKMNALWRCRFVTWGMWVAVFGMRFVIPLLIVCSAARIGPVKALQLALFKSGEYARLLQASHHQILAFGGSFLLMASLRYFFDVNKEVHWIKIIEGPLAKLGKLESIEIGVVLLFLYLLSNGVPPNESAALLRSGLAGILVFIVTESLGSLLQGSGGQSGRTSLGLFLYLEILDASFSFDGVVGAFAISSQLPLIALGLGIGAMFVRSLTLLMVDRGTLETFVFLEHGGFWAVAALAALMFLQIMVPVPEVVTSLVGVTIIGLSLWSSLRNSI
ncbi:MAG: hypothetical protein C5B49_11530 [Bdellovibrio sp.]|nr:MAG: hypothetical protein C5B49_11530 [Bdellovibrio sp.]